MFALPTPTNESWLLSPTVTTFVSVDAILNVPISVIWSSNTLKPETILGTTLLEGAPSYVVISLFVIPVSLIFLVPTAVG